MSLLSIAKLLKKLEPIELNFFEQKVQYEKSEPERHITKILRERPRPSGRG